VFPDEQKPDMESIFGRLNLDRARIDKAKLKFGLDCFHYSTRP
jgi:hypothetical protein